MASHHILRSPLCAASASASVAANACVAGTSCRRFVARETLSDGGRRSRGQPGWSGSRSLTSHAPALPQRRKIHSSGTRRSDSASSSAVPAWASNDARIALEGFRARFVSESSSSNGKDNAPLVSEYRQILDGNQVHLLRLTQAGMVPLGNGQSHRASDGTQRAGSEAEVEKALRQREERILAGPDKDSAVYAGIRPGTPLVPTEHLGFFTPRVPTSTLGADGSDTSFNPPGGVFTRRMWAGGSMSFLQKAREGEAAAAASQQQPTDLQIGDEAWERTFVEDAQLKQLGAGRGEMMVVWVRKEIGTERAGLSLVDRRSWVFQRALPVPVPGQDHQQQRQRDRMPAAMDAQQQQQQQRRQPPSPLPGLIAPTHLRQTPADLFRYSAMTFNAHAIHLSPPWAQAVEGHADVVVHGPLNLALLVRKWGRHVAGWHLAQGRSGAAKLHPAPSSSSSPSATRRLVRVDYRAKRPVYAGMDYWVGFASTAEDADAGSSSSSIDPAAATHKVVAVLADGSVAMEATITSEAG